MVKSGSTIWFIANFHSGTLSVEKKEALSIKIKQLPNCQLFLTEYPLHACEIAAKAILENINAVVAIGGDGTINEVGSVLKGTKIAMGIIPIGSGNGLARHLKIPMSPFEAIDKVFNGKIIEIDTCSINNIPFFCTAGFGFDAHVAENFSLKSKRGFLSYIKTTIETYFSFQPFEIECSLSKNMIKQKAFAITFANAAQYGNDAKVAPEAKIDDGLLDLVILKPFPAIYAIILGVRLFTNSFSKSKFVTVIKESEFSIKVPSPCIIHFDGEPKTLNTNELNVKIEKEKLSIIV